jgi:hypothetical protein
MEGTSAATVGRLPDVERSRGAQASLPAVAPASCRRADTARLPAGSQRSGRQDACAPLHECSYFPKRRKVTRPGSSGSASRSVRAKIADRKGRLPYVRRAVASGGNSLYRVDVQWMEEWTRRHASLVLLAIGAVAILLLQAILHIHTPDVAQINAHEAEEFRAFSVWAATYALLMVAITWASIVAGKIAKQYLTPDGFGWTVSLAAFCTVLVGVLSRVRWKDQDLLAIVERSRDIPLRTLTMFGNALAVGGAALVIGACVGLATDPERLTVPELRKRVAESRLLLFSAAVFLVVGVAEIYLVFQLPVAVSNADGARLTILQHVTSSITLIAGLLYTSVLLLLFVPVAVVHEQWIDDAWQAASGEKHKEWLEETGLHRSIGATTSQLIAAAAPLLAALGLVPS